MQKLIIKGSQELSGKISISGSKNASLPILAASILANKVRIKDIPLVKDIFTMIELLNFIGLKTKLIKKKNIVEILNSDKNILGMMPHPERMVDDMISNKDGINLFLSLLN